MVSLDRVSVQRGSLGVVRDDRLFGGTKQRAAVPYLRRKKEEGAAEFVYASPFCGFAQVAIAAAAKEVGCRVTLFCEQDVTQTETGRLHAFSQLAAEQGAKVVTVASLAEAESSARAYAEKAGNRLKIPLGLDCPVFRARLREEISLCWTDLVQKSRRAPDALWVAAGSGTIGQVMRDVLPSSVELKLVDVGVLPADDPRLQALRARKRVSWMRSPESFFQPALSRPPVPSNAHYDAKLWRYLFTEASDGDVWWNIAR